MSLGNVKAEVITCPGRLGDAEYFALQINVDGFESPYVLTLRMPAIGARALSERIKPVDLYEAMAQAINLARVHVEVLKAEEQKEKPRPDPAK